MSNDFNDFMNTPDDTGMYDTQDIQTNKVWAALLIGPACTRTS